MLHIGTGETGLNNLLAVLNLNCINTHTLKRSEDEVGEAIEKLTEQSINNALDMEYEATLR